jgi:hypothetical protein
MQAYLVEKHIKPKSKNSTVQGEGAGQPCTNMLVSWFFVHVHNITTIGVNNNADNQLGLGLLLHLYCHIVYYFPASCWKAWNGRSIGF